MTEEQIVEARLLHTAAPALLPVINALHDTAYNRLLDSFRDGSKDNLALVAECAAYKNIIDEIKYKIGNLERHYEKENK